jgi:hypothetical protein
LPFVSIELLISQKAVYHKPEHDLESIFFVFIYLCTNLSGPKVARTVSELQEFKSLPMASWFNPAVSLQRLGSDKISAMMLFELRILPYFAKYFDDLKPCALELCQAIYPTPSTLLQPEGISHDKIIEIFNKALEFLPEEGSSSSPSDLAIDQVGRKRHLGIHDNALNFNRLGKKKKGSVSCSNSGIRSSTGSRSLLSASSTSSSKRPKQ